MTSVRSFLILAFLAVVAEEIDGVVLLRTPYGIVPAIVVPAGVMPSYPAYVAPAVPYGVPAASRLYPSPAVYPGALAGSYAGAYPVAALSGYSAPVAGLPGGYPATLPAIPAGYPAPLAAISGGYPTPPMAAFPGGSPSAIALPATIPAVYLRKNKNKKT